MLVRNVNMSLLVLLMLTAGVSMPDRFMDEADVMTRAAPPPRSSPVICGRIQINLHHRSALGASRKYMGHMSHLDKNVNEMPDLNEPVGDEPDMDTYVGDEPRLYTNIRHEPETDQHVSDELETDQHDIEEPDDLDKILGGRYATLGEVPWQANILINGLSDYFTSKCSGAIISEFWIFTTGFCIGNANTVVVVGDEIQSRRDPGEQVYRVDKSIRHPSFTVYSSRTINHDVGLVRIKADSNGRGIIFGDYVQPVCLPDWSSDPIENKTLIVTGWSRAQWGAMSDILKLIEMKAHGHRTCFNYYRTQTTVLMMCAGYTSQYMCLGDRGSPAVYNKGGVHTLYGIVSLMLGCTKANSPYLFTSVRYELGWIYKHIKLNSDSVDQQRLPVRPQSM